MKKEEFKDLTRPIVYGHQSGWLLEDYTEMLMEICEKYHNEQLKLSVVVRQSEQCHNCEESTGETKLWCCNHCGKRKESF